MAGSTDAEPARVAQPRGAARISPAHTSWALGQLLFIVFLQEHCLGCTMKFSKQGVNTMSYTILFSIVCNPLFNASCEKL